MTDDDAPGGTLPEPDAYALYNAARILRINAQELRDTFKPLPHPAHPDNDARAERAALACEQVADWLEQVADDTDL